jgi:hypothetical protein
LAKRNANRIWAGQPWRLGRTDAARDPWAPNIDENDPNSQSAIGRTCLLLAINAVFSCGMTMHSTHIRAIARDAV